MMELASPSTKATAALGAMVSLVKFGSNVTVDVAARLVAPSMARTSAMFQMALVCTSAVPL